MSPEDSEVVTPYDVARSKKFTECQDVQVGALVLRLSVVISIKVYLYLLPPTARVDNIRNLARRHFAAHAHGHHFFVGRALLVPVLITLRLPQPRVRHIFAPLPCAQKALRTR